MSADQLNVADIYVMRQGAALEHQIAPGSGIVGKPDRNGLTLIYFEGNLLDTPALRSYEGRIACVTRRLFENIPTTALIYVDQHQVEESLLKIGDARWNPDTESCSVTIDASKTALLTDYLQQSQGK